MIILEWLLVLGAFVVIGLLCSFLIILNNNKDNLWEEIKGRYFNGK